MTPASKTPHIAASTLDLKFIFKKLAASVPVHAPVPGSGIPTNKSNATKSPLPAVACNFYPPFSPFAVHQRQNLPIILGILLPISSTFLANK